MQGTYKTRISEQQLQTIITHTFHQPFSQCQELVDGWANTAYRITLVDGTKLVLKLAPTKDIRLMRCEKASMETEVKALQLARQSGDIPVPNVYIYDPSRSLSPAEYFIMDFLEGVPYNEVKSHLSVEQQVTIEKQLANYCKSIHAYSNDSFGYFLKEKGWNSSWRFAFEKLITDVLADGQDAGVELPHSYVEIENLVARHLPLLDEVSVPQLIHWDLWEGNIFVLEQQITGIVDFERALWGDPLIEHYFGRFANSPAFQEEYLGRALTEIEKARRVLYDFYLDLVLVIECAYRNYQNEDHVRWTYENFQHGFNQLASL